MVREVSAGLRHACERAGVASGSINFNDIHSGVGSNAYVEGILVGIMEQRLCNARVKRYLCIYHWPVRSTPIDVPYYP